MSKPEKKNERAEDKHPTDLDNLLGSAETPFKSKIQPPKSGSEAQPLDVALNDEGVPGRRGGNTDEA